MILAGGGIVTNGGTNDHTALIEGYTGLLLSGSGVNFGTIEGFGLLGAELLEGASLTNGAAGDTTATVGGWYGVRLEPEGTLTNFGTVSGAEGTAVNLGVSDTLAVEAGSTFIGSVIGGGGLLELGSGVGTVAAPTLASVTVSGSMATTTFDDFGTLEIGVGASFTLTGTAAIASGQSLIDDGTLTVTGAFTSAGTLGGTGTLDFASGTDALTGGTLSTANVNVTGATVTLSGSIAVPSTVSLSGKLVVAAAGATLTGAGTVVLTNSAANEITGASASAVLDNKSHLEGEGQLGAGSMELINDGDIISLGAGVLTINTGASTILDYGDMISEGTGGLTIDSPVDNTGELLAYSSPLTITAAVTGAGDGVIENAASLILKGRSTRTSPSPPARPGRSSLGTPRATPPGQSRAARSEARPRSICSTSPSSAGPPRPHTAEPPHLAC